MKIIDMNPVHPRFLALSLFVILIMSLPAFGQNNEETLPGDYATHFDQYDVKGSMVIYDLKSNRTFYYDKERTQKRFSPASTFKIFNSLVGLETGVIPDTSYVIPWDSVKRGNYAPWNRSNSLKSAFKYSVVWYYQELARRVGEERMEKYITANGYGMTITSFTRRRACRLRTIFGMDGTSDGSKSAMMFTFLQHTLKPMMRGRSSRERDRELRWGCFVRLG